MPTTKLQRLSAPKIERRVLKRQGVDQVDQVVDIPMEYSEVEMAQELQMNEKFCQTMELDVDEKCCQTKELEFEEKCCQTTERRHADVDTQTPKVDSPHEFNGFVLFSDFFVQSSAQKRMQLRHSLKDLSISNH